MALDVYADELSALAWDALIAAIAAEMNVGPAGPGTGSNTGGRLQSLYMVHESIDMWSNLLPSAAVQLEDVDCSEAYSNIHDYAKISFTIVLATQAVVNANGQVVLDDAMRRLRTLIADGTGNGLGPVLRDRANFTLGGIVNESHVEGWKLQWQLPTETDTDARAFALVKYVCKNKVLKLG